MQLTSEQQDIISTCLDPKTSLLTVEAVSGAGKTATLVEIAKALKPKSGMYLAYNKAIATEATEKFIGTTIICSTIHSLAYRATVKKYGLRVGFFKARDIDKKVDFLDRIEIATIIEDFCLSKYTDVNVYLNDMTIDMKLRPHVLLYLDKMARGDIQSNHSFYLKFYHILLASGEVEAPSVDILMLDEFGDITGLTLEIFKLINAKLKVAVGDSMQTIYRFNKTINGFKALKGQGVRLRLSQSFRVATPIAERIEAFCHEYIDEDVDFKGQEYPKDKKPESHAFIARTNGVLIGEMIRLGNMHIEYNLTRPVKAMFSLLLTLMNLKENITVHDPQYKFIERDLTQYYAKKDLQQRFGNPLRYIGAKHEEDMAIQSAIALIGRHSFKILYDVYNAAKAHEAAHKVHHITLTTAHSSKGLEYDEVTILGDLNEAFTRAEEAANEDPGDIEATLVFEDEIKLYYVACSRARIKLNNAGHLPTFNK